MLLHFSIIRALKAIDSYYICTVEIRYTGVLLHINFQPHVQWCHIGTLTSAMDIG